CDERFPSTTSLPPFLDLSWRYCVKTPKGRSRRGIVFYRRHGFRVVLQPLATTLVLGEEGHSMRSACPSVLTRPRPTPELDTCSGKATYTLLLQVCIDTL